MFRPSFMMSAALLSCAYLAGVGLAWGEAASPDTQPAKSVAKPQAKVEKKAKTEKKAKVEKAAVTATSPVLASVAPQTQTQTQALAPREAPVAVAPVDTSKNKAAAVAARDVPATPVPKGNPYLGTPYLRDAQIPSPGPFSAASPVSNPLKGLSDLLPSIPDGMSILPKISTVYPTGEKPLKVLTFKCPTELIGITPPPIKLLHEAINLGMDGVNRTNLLSFNMQQVCQ